MTYSQMYMILASGKNPANYEKSSDAKKARESCGYYINGAGAHWTADSIYTAYGRPSVYKVRSWHELVKVCQQLNGYNMRVFAHGCQTYSCGFEYTDPETGVLCCAYFTRDYARFSEQ